MVAEINPQSGHIIWSDKWSVGNATLDQDHKAFFDIANLLMTGQKSSDHMFVDSAIAILEEYVDGHFFREEKAMQTVGYPRFADHRLKHLRFKSRIQAIGESFRGGVPSAADGLAELVGDWLIKHILSDDKLYENWINDGVVDHRPLAFLAMDAGDH